MKNRKSILAYTLLALTLIMLSISCTLALIQDSESKVGSIIKFDKVSLCGDYENGSRLSIEMGEDSVGSGFEILNEENYFMVKPTNDTVECYIRLRIYYTLNNEELDEEFKTELDVLNNDITNGKPLGLNLYSNEEYGYVSSDRYIYLVTKNEQNENTEFLKVVTQEDYVDGFIICNDYSLNFDTTKQDLVVNLGNLHQIYLKVEVQAIQCLNLATLKEDTNASQTQDVILSQNQQNISLEEYFGYVTIEDYKMAILYNVGKDGITKDLPTERKTFNNYTWKEIKAISSVIVDNPTKGAVTVEYNASTLTYTIHNNVRFISYDVKIGDTKDLVFTNNVTMTMIVSGFLHDSDENGNLIGISFTSKGLYQNVTKTHNGSSQQTGGSNSVTYVGSNVRSFIVNELYPLVPDDVKKLIVAPKKACAGGYYTPTEFVYVTDKLWALSCRETNLSFNSIYAYSREGKPYEYYKRYSRAKRFYNGTGGSGTYHTRTMVSGSKNTCYYIESNGSLGDYYMGVYNWRGIAFGLCI